MNLAEAILSRMAVDPERPAITLLDDRGNERETWTRGRLARRSRWWQSRIEGAARPGDRVVLSPDRSPDLAALHLGALAAGVVVVPLNPALSPVEGRALIASAAPVLIVTSSKTAERFGPAAHDPQAVPVTGRPNKTRPPWWTTESCRIETKSSATSGGAASASYRGTSPVTGASVECGGRPQSGADTVESDGALLLFTSGTTGRPKSVPLSHANLLANLEALAGLWQLSASDCVLHMLPAHHFHGLVPALYGSLLAGSSIVMMPRFDARGALDTIRRYHVDVMMGVPTMYARMLDAARPDDDLSRLRLAISGSAPLGATLWHRFHERFGVTLVERYGLTETGIVASNPPATPRAGSVGKPLPGTRVVIAADGTYHEHTSGGRSPRGEICVSGPAVSVGYGNDPEATVAAYRNGFFHTGDLGYFDEEGYLWIDGRIKELVIVGGSNVVPGEVAAALEDVEGVAELAIVGVAHADLGEVVGAIVVAQGARTSDDARGGRSASDERPAPTGGIGSATGRGAAHLEAALRRRAEERLAAYKRPRHYAFVEEIPRNTMGKIDVAACRRLFDPA